MANIGQDLASVPISDMIAALGVGIAKAQFELDQTSADVARMMSGINPADRVQFGGQSLSLIELGFTPTFYQFIESTIEIKVIVKMSRTASSELTAKTKTDTVDVQSSYAWWRPRSRVQATTQTVDAKIASTYDYSIEGSSLVRTKLVPVPPPAILEERIRSLMEDEAQVRYQLGLQRALKEIRADMVKAIEDWPLPANAVIHSLSDLQAHFLENTAHASFRKKVTDFPDILLDQPVNEEFQEAFSKYKEMLKTEVRAELEKWEFSETEIFDSLRETRAFFFSTQPLRLDIRQPELSHLLTEDGAIKYDFARHYQFGAILEFLSLWELTEQQKASLNTKADIEDAFFQAVADTPRLDVLNLKTRIKNSQVFKDRITELQSTTRRYTLDAILEHLRIWEPAEQQKLIIADEQDLADIFFADLDDQTDLDATGLKSNLREETAFKTRMATLLESAQQFNLAEALRFAASWSPGDEQKNSIANKPQLIAVFFAAARQESFNTIGIETRIENDNGFKQRINELDNELRAYHVDAIVNFAEEWEPTPEQRTELSTIASIEVAFFAVVENRPDLQLTTNKDRVRNKEQFKTRMQTIKDSLQAEQ